MIEQGFAVVASKRNGADGKPMDAALIAWADQQNLMMPIDRNTDWGNPFEKGRRRPLLTTRRAIDDAPG